MPGESKMIGEHVIWAGVTLSAFPVHPFSQSNQSLTSVVRKESKVI